MENIEPNNWEELREEAEACLAGDFARSVVQQSIHRKKLRQQQPRLALVTVLLLVLGINGSCWWQAHQVEQQQVAQWEQWQSFQQVVLTSL